MSQRNVLHPHDCLCLPLHVFCDPETCKVRQAASLTGLDIENDEPAVITNLAPLRQAAHRGCYICATYYAGLNFPFSEYPRIWEMREKEQDLKVSISGRGRVVVSVELTLRVTKTSHKGLRHDGQMTRLLHQAFHFYASPDSELAMTCRVFTLQKSSSKSTASQVSFEDISRWMQACKSHSLCAREEAPPLPKRVLDIGSNETMDADIVLTEPGGSRAPYIALSHCWGSAQTATTIRLTIAERMRGISMSKLPKTFQHAVYITRRLGYRYLWIDSLCIIQDDAFDWEQESSKMSAIYENAELTIAASDSASGNDGCFRRTDKLTAKASARISPFLGWAPEVTQSDSPKHRLVCSPQVSEMEDSHAVLYEKCEADDCRIMFADLTEYEIEAFQLGGAIKAVFSTSSDNDTNIKTSPTIAIYCVPKAAQSLHDKDYHGTAGSPRRRMIPNTTSGVYVSCFPSIDHFQFIKYGYTRDFPLASRAWALQECLLSTRMVHYTRDELVWECKTMASCQCQQITHDLTLSPKVSGSIWTNQTLKEVFEHVLCTCDEREAARLWQNLVFHFTQRRLTWSTDRLAAISGLAKRFEQFDLGRYLAGTWERHLSKLLLRRADQDASHDNRHSSYLAPTWSWASVKSGVGFAECLDDYSIENLFLVDPKVYGKILNVQCTPAGQDSRGAVRHGELTIQTNVIDAKLVIEVNSTADSRHEYVCWIIYNGQRTLLNRDSLSDFDFLETEHDVLCALWDIRPEIHELPAGVSENFCLSSHAIILRPSTATNGAYERTGLCSLIFLSPYMSGLRPRDPDYDDWFDLRSTQTLTIV